jgi:hypothetical protein
MLRSTTLSLSVLRQAPGSDEVHYTLSVDLFSAGVVACELAARHLLVHVDGGSPAPAHRDASYFLPGPLARDGLAVLRALPDTLASSMVAQRCAGGIIAVWARLVCRVQWWASRIVSYCCPCALVARAFVL